MARDPAGHQLLPSGSQGPGSAALFNDTWTWNGTTRTRLQPTACMPRGGERAAARWGPLGEGVEPVFRPGARCPLAGLLLALPALEDTGLLACARGEYGRLKNGFYGLAAATLLNLVFLAAVAARAADGGRAAPGAAAELHPDHHRRRAGGDQAAGEGA